MNRHSRISRSWAYVFLALLFLRVFTSTVQIGSLEKGGDFALSGVGEESELNQSEDGLP